MDDKEAAREEWFYSQREYPLGQIPAGARVKAIADIQNIQRTIRARRQTAPPPDIAPARPLRPPWMLPTGLLSDRSPPTPAPPMSPQAA